MKILLAYVALLIIGAITTAANAFVVAPRTTNQRCSQALSMSIFDDLKLIFSDEGKKNRAEFEQRERDEMREAQQEVLERRRNPAKMRAYEQEKLNNRVKLDAERKVYDFQSKVEKGYDPLSDWTRLRNEGKILIGKDLKRDETTSRLGSEGLIDVRVDERMPYIDQGYVSEDADFMGQLMNIFGGGKKNKQ